MSSRGLLSSCSSQDTGNAAHQGPPPSVARNWDLRVHVLELLRFRDVLWKVLGAGGQAVVKT